MLNYSIAGLSMLMNIVSIVWLVSALMLIGIILIQKGKGGGLGGAFGGAGGGGGLLGTKTGDFLTWVTISLVFLFFILGIVLVKYGKDTGTDGLEKIAPAATEQVDLESDVIADTTEAAQESGDTENTTK